MKIHQLDRAVRAISQLPEEQILAKTINSLISIITNSEIISRIMKDRKIKLQLDTFKAKIVISQVLLIKALITLMI